MRLIEILESRKEALKVSEVAKILSVTPQHIYKMAKARLIPCFHGKGAVRFCPTELAAWIKQEKNGELEAVDGIVLSEQGTARTKRNPRRDHPGLA